jgi:hypothetical protein
LAARDAVVAGRQRTEPGTLKMQPAILQIVPRKPGALDGVGDYALRLAQQLRVDRGIETRFATPPLEVNNKDEFSNCSAIILHYVNYGYHPRGIPKQLPSLVRELKQGTGAILLTIFHELYASGPPWRSAFWLQSSQKSIAREIARLSEACVASSETMRAMLQRLAPAAKVLVHPVISTLGEPGLSVDQFVRRDPHRWVIFGGTHLLQRSLNTFRERFARIPETVSPQELYLLGGKQNAAVRDAVARLGEARCYYQPEIEASAASEILSTCSFGWIDYFQQRHVPTDVILKSGSFASYCAHGVIPVVPHITSAIELRGERMPGLCFVESNGSNLPAPAERARISEAVYNWYRRHGSVTHLARAVAASLETRS